jgi:tRNA(Ile)-lysidine synthase TilS/MesJ
MEREITQIIARKRPLLPESKEVCFTWTKGYVLQNLTRKFVDEVMEENGKGFDYKIRYSNGEIEEVSKLKEQTCERCFDFITHQYEDNSVKNICEECAKIIDNNEKLKERVYD